MIPLTYQEYCAAAFCVILFGLLNTMVILFGSVEKKDDND